MINEATLKTILPVMHLLKKYHRHEIKHVENVPKSGGALILTNHSLATYDGLLLGLGIYLETSRMPYGLADTNLFTLPFLRDISPKINLVEASHENAEKLLAQDELVCIAPGGMKEAIRSSEHRREIIWHKRTGFARLAVRTQSPIVLAACPNADGIYDVKANSITNFIYENFKLPFVIPRGVGPTLIPRPVKLTHYLSEPLYPPKVDENDESYLDELYDFHERVVKTMREMMGG